MTPLLYERASDVGAGVGRRARTGAQYLGGGTNLVDLMRETIEHPPMLVDVTGLSRQYRGERSDGGLRIGAGVKNTARGRSACARAPYPMLAQAILAGGLRSDPQHGDGGRQSPAAHPLRLLLRRRRALQ